MAANSNIATEIRELSESNNFNTLKEKLQSFKPTESEDNSNVLLDAILSELDVSRHSYGYFFILYV